MPSTREPVQWTVVLGALFYFPNNEADALLHAGASAIFLGARCTTSAVPEQR